LGVEFKGGYSYNVQFDKATDLNTLRNNLTKAFDGASTIVKAVSTANTFNITTSYRINESGTEVADQVVAKLHEAVVATGSNMTLDQFKNTESKGTHITSSSKVGPTIADDIKSSAWKTAILGMLGIFLYILLRFSRWQYSAGAVIALIHDVLFTMSFFTLLHGILPFSLEVDSAIIAAILTLIGYSVNDTVIVYDRIREYVHTYSKLSMSDIINKSINSVLTRTVVTSLTVFLVLLVLFIFGGSSIRGFSFALLIGVVVGTYSSIFIAAPIMLDLSRNLDLTEVQILTVEEKIAARNPDGEEKPAKKGKAAKKS
jgi:SecD/SecF fusion protein